MAMVDEEVNTEDRSEDDENGSENREEECPVDTEVCDLCGIKRGEVRQYTNKKGGEGSMI